MLENMSSLQIRFTFQGMKVTNDESALALIFMEGLMSRLPLLLTVVPLTKIANMCLTSTATVPVINFVIQSHHILLVSEVVFIKNVSK